MADSEARTLLAQALEIDPNMVAVDASVATLEAWDSLAHVRLITAIEARLGRQLTPEEAVEIASVSDVAALLSR